MYVMTASAGMLKVRALIGIGDDTMTSSFNAVAVMVKVLIWMQSSRMYVAVLAVMVTVSAMGAMMCMEAEGAVTVTVGDKGAVIVMLAPIGPVVEKVQGMGEM